MNIHKIQYDAKLELVFANGDLKQYNGFAFIERNPDDSLFGYSFYAIRKNNHQASIYNDGIAFLISTKEHNFSREKADQNLLGRYGGLMVYSNLFTLDSIYKSVDISETENSFMIHYTFKEDLKNEITEKTKTLELSKETYLLKKVTMSQRSNMGIKVRTEYDFENVKINDQIDKSIEDYIEDLNQLELVIEEESKPNKLLNNPLPSIALINLFNENERVPLRSNKVTLLDFWEVWCGPCIASFPKVEELKQKFTTDLNIIGIVSEDKTNAIKLVQKKGTTFLNLMGNRKLLETFGVNGYPRYFLVDKNGIIQKEYYGFSSQIETDIEELIQQQ